MNQNKEIEKLGALALLDRGISFRIPAPAMFMLFGKKTISIKVKRLYLGTLLHLSTLEAFGIDPVEVPQDHSAVITDMEAKPFSTPIKVIVEQSVPVCRAVASCLLNSRMKIFLFSKLFGRYLRRSCTPDQIREIIMWLFIYGRPESFTITTTFLRRMTITSPRTVGQVERS